MPNISVIIPTVAASAVEAEYASSFIVGQAATSIMHTAIDLGYPQHTIHMTSDNSCAVGIANNTVKQKRSKALDMRYHWLRDQVKQRKITIVWKPGAVNLADFLEGVLMTSSDMTVSHHIYNKQPLVDAMYKPS